MWTHAGNFNLKRPPSSETQTKCTQFETNRKWQRRFVIVFIYAQYIWDFIYVSSSSSSFLFYFFVLYCCRSMSVNFKRALPLENAPERSQVQRSAQSAFRIHRRTQHFLMAISWWWWWRYDDVGGDSGWWLCLWYPMDRRMWLTYTSIGLCPIVAVASSRY